MNHNIRIGLLILPLLCLFLNIHHASSKETIWLRGSFKEIGSASPVVGHATFTLELARKAIAATPKKYVEEVKYTGFDIPALFQAVDAMPVGEKLEVQKEDMKLMIEKFVIDEPEESISKLLLIKMQSPDDSLNLPIPLALTSTAVSLLQFGINDLAGLDKELAAMLDEVKRTKPGVVLIGEDKLMNSTLEVKLQ